MSASQYRSQLERKRQQRVDAERREGDFRAKESKRRAEAAKARLDATKARSSSSAASKAREAERRDKEAAAAGADASRWAAKAAKYRKEEASLHEKVGKAERSEAAAVERKRVQQQVRAERQAQSTRSALEERVNSAEVTVDRLLQAIPAPKPEKLRVLILGAAADGDLRVGREQKRIRNAVESALHRDQIELDVRPAATADDLLDGITAFRPHIVHFSGHSSDQLIVFEDEVDVQHQGAVVSAAAFRMAIAASDSPPILVLLNSCNSAAQIDALVAEVCLFAIGMADSIDDSDAITFAARFYAALANGQSIAAANRAGQAALAMAGLDSSELPTLACADGADPSQALLVAPES